MMTILVAMDKFKGSLSALEACNAIQKGIQKQDETINVLACPMADGGDGSLVVLEQYEQLDTVEVKVFDPLMRPIKAFYKLNKSIAYIEMATASGLMLLTKEEQNCMYTTTFGTGQLILDAIQKGVKTIYLFIGGSATNDGGIGMAAALGYRFFDQLGKKLSPRGKSLIQIATIDDKNLLFDRNDITVKVISDVQNPLTGKNGAAWVYGQQKGASLSEIICLDQGLNTLANQLVKQSYPDIKHLAGAGAAGGFGGGAVAFLNAQLFSGTSFFIDKTRLKSHLKTVDLIITGEGSLDKQSLEGKVVAGICKLAQQHQIPAIILCGRSEFKEILSLGVQHIYNIMDLCISEKEAIETASEKLSILIQHALTHKN